MTTENGKWIENLLEHDVCVIYRVSIVVYQHINRTSNTEKNMMAYCLIFFNACDKPT